MGASLAGRRVVVIGASAGIGRSFARRALADGAAVVAVARRGAPLDELTAPVPAGTPVEADVCDEDGRRRIVDAVATALDQVDAILFAVGYAQLRRLAASDAGLWRTTLETNVVAFNQVVQGLVPHLAPGSVVVALSSETAGAPRSGLVHYAASKAALDASLRGWRVEHPEVRFTCVRVGATQPTDFGMSFDMDELGPALDSWVHHGLMQERMMPTDDVSGVLADATATLLAHPEVGMEDLVLRSPSSVIGSSAVSLDDALEGAVGPEG